MKSPRFLCFVSEFEAIYKNPHILNKITTLFIIIIDKLSHLYSWTYITLSLSQFHITFNLTVQNYFHLWTCLVLATGWAMWQCSFITYCISTYSNAHLNTFQLKNIYLLTFFNKGSRINNWMRPARPILRIYIVQYFFCDTMLLWRSVLVLCFQSKRKVEI